MSRRNQTMLGILGIVLLVGAVLNANTTETTLTDQAKYNTNRNAFLSGCEKPYATAGYSSEQAKRECECVLTKLEKKYPDFVNNATLIQDKLKNGLSKEDTDLVISCNS